MEDQQRIDFRPWLMWLGVVLLAMVALSAFAWARVPADKLIPTHYGLNGKPNGWMYKSGALTIIPLITVILMGVLIFIARFSPEQENIQASGSQHRGVFVSVLFFFLAIHAFIVATALGAKLDIYPFIQIMLGLLFFVLGYFSRRIKRNKVAGFRTRWTFASDLSWEKTNDLGGKLFMISGISLVLLALFAGMELWFGIFIAEIILITLFSYAYSYFVWKNDPARDDT